MKTIISIIFLSFFLICICDDRLRTIPLSSIKELKFESGKKTKGNNPTDQLVCEESDGNFCEYHQLRSVVCKHHGNNSFECSRIDLPLLIDFDETKVRCSVMNPFPKVDPLIIEGSCYLRYGLKRDWLRILGFIFIISISYCIVTVVYVKIFLRRSQQT